MKNQKETIKKLIEAAQRRNKKLNQYNGFVGKLLAQKRITKEEVNEFFKNGKKQENENNE